MHMSAEKKRSMRPTLLLIGTAALAWVCLGIVEGGHVHGVRVLSEQEAALIRGSEAIYPCRSFHLGMDCPNNALDHMLCEGIDPTIPGNLCSSGNGNYPDCSTPVQNQYCQGSTVGWDDCLQLIHLGGCGYYYFGGHDLLHAQCPVHCV
jgi:hypothetical protein